MDQSHPLDPTLKVSGASATPTIRLLKNDITRNYFEGMKTADPLTSIMMAIDMFWNKFALALLVHEL